MIGFVASVLDTKVSRDEMSEHAELVEHKLRCIARRVNAVQTKVDGDPMDPAAGTKKARCISCDRVVNVVRPYVLCFIPSSVGSMKSVVS